MLEKIAGMTPITAALLAAAFLTIRFALGKPKTPILKWISETSETLGIAIGVVFLIIRPFIVQSFYIPSPSMRPGLLERDHLMINKFIYRFREPRHGEVIVFRSPPEASPDGVEKDYIKRIMGLPGDTLQVVPAQVSIDGMQCTHKDLQTLLADYAPSNRDVYVKLTNKGILVTGKPVSAKQLAIKAGRPNATIVIRPGYVIRNGKKLDEPYISEDPEELPPHAKWPLTKPTKVPKGKIFVMGDNRNESNDSRFWGPFDRKRILGKTMFLYWPVTRIRWIR